MAIRIQSLLAILLTSLLFTSCIEYEDVEFLGVENYSIDKVSSDDVKITLHMKIENPNTYNIKVKKSILNLYLNDKKLGKAIMQEDVKLMKKSTEVHQIAVVATVKDLSKGLLSSLGMLFGKTADLRIQGDVKAKAFGIGKTFEVDFTQEISAADLKF